MMKTNRLIDICEIAAGGTPPRGNTEYYSHGTIPWVKSGELSQGEIHDTKEHITQDGLKNSAAKIFPVDTVLVAMYGATVGSVGILKIAAATNQAVCGIQPPLDIYPEYLYLYLRSKKEFFISKTAGGGQPNISAETIKKLVFSYPENINEQKTIAVRLKAQLAAIDVLKNKTELQLKNAEVFIERRITNHLVIRKTAEWMTGTVDDYSIVNPSVRDISRKLDDDELVSFVPMPSVSAEEGRITDHIVRPYAEVHKGYTYFEEGDILFAKITPCMQNGKIAIANGLENGIGFGSTEFHVIRTGENVIPEWLYYLFRRKAYLSQAETNLQGAVGQQRLPDCFIRQTAVSFPKSTDEQKRIIDALNTEIAQCASLIAKLRKQQKNIEALRACIFREAFRSEE